MEKARAEMQKRAEQMRQGPREPRAPGVAPAAPAK
jgi:hypothetical protein